VSGTFLILSKNAGTLPKHVSARPFDFYNKYMEYQFHDTKPADVNNKQMVPYDIPGRMTLPERTFIQSLSNAGTYETPGPENPGEHM
jgi:hypothetical protein